MRKFLALFFAGLLLSACQTTSESSSPSESAANSLKTLSSEHVDIYYEVIDEEAAKQASALAEKSYDEIVAYLNEEATERIAVNVHKFSDRGAHASRRRPRIDIPLRQFTNKARQKAILVHELTHIIAGSAHDNSGMLEEGLAMHLEWLLAREKEEDVEPSKFLHAWAKRVSEATSNQTISIKQYDFARVYFSPNSRNEVRRRAYFRSGSFVRYLIETYGLNTFKQVYYGGISRVSWEKT